MKTDLNTIIIKNAEHFLNNKTAPGHNGPYNDPETYVRTHAHLSILFFKAFKITKNNKYKKEAIRQINFLLLKEARPYNSTFHYRNKKGKDKCNGLIGQAWSIEALMIAYENTKDIKYKNLAKQAFHYINYHNFLSYWKKREINGKELFLDLTFNHQLWFAAASSLISNSKKDTIGKEINKFMDELENNLHIHKNGLIRHFIYPQIITPLNFLMNNTSKKYLYTKEASYHSFNLYAFAILKQRFPSHKFWRSKKFKKLTQYAISKEHLKIAEKNKYGFSYNPSGIETAFFIYTFKEQFNKPSKMIKIALEKQFRRNLNTKTLTLTEKTSDPNTLALRIYEATRIPNLKLDF